MRQPTGNRIGGSTWSAEISRQHVAGALRYAMKRAGATQTSVAKWCKKSERTVRYWLAEQVVIDVESVLRSGRLRRQFLRYLTVCDKKDAA